MPELIADQTKDYSWAEYLDCMEGGTDDVVSLPPSKAAKPAPGHSIWAGLILTVILTVVALYVSEVNVWPFTLPGGRHPIEAVMLAMIFGMVVSNLVQLPKGCGAGIKFSVKKLLPVGIILLGARLNFGSIIEVGAASVALSVLETVVAFCMLLWLSHQLKLPRKLGLLLGVGTAICGGTAIVATAPVIEADEKDVVFGVATVTLLGLIWMFTLPVLGEAFGMTPKAFGVWAGLSIHQTPQVIAAGFAYGKDPSLAGSTATIVKLARVCLLAPVVFVVGWLHARSEMKVHGPAARKNISYFRLFPMFVFGFLALALLRTLKLLPELHFASSSFFSAKNQVVDLPGLCDKLSKYCIVISMAGVGLETKFSAMKQTGMKPFMASLVAALVITALIFTLIRVLQIR
jgi:uncharacterized integral membrane protein (TIGR00698 family)